MSATKRLMARARLGSAGVALGAAATLVGCSGSDDLPAGPPLALTTVLDEASETGAIASPIFELTGRTTTFEFTQEPAKGFKRSDLDRTTVYLVSTESQYGTRSYEALKNGSEAEDLEDDALLFTLSMDGGDTFGDATMEVEKNNPPFHLRGSYRLFVRTDHGVVTAKVKEKA